jgi:hypothetical protein
MIFPEFIALIAVLVAVACLAVVVSLMLVPLEAYSKAWIGARPVRAGNFMASAARGDLKDCLNHATPTDQLWDISQSLPHIVVVRGRPRAMRAARLLYALIQ